MYKKFIILLPVILFCFCNGCDTVEEEEKLTYTINKVWWSDSIDTNQDGYIQSKKLNLDVRIAEGVSRTINASVYYKRSDAADFNFYAFSGEQPIQGSNTSNNISVPIGNINKELDRGLYDFKVEIWEAGKDKIQTTTGSNDSLLLTGQKFEQSSADKNYSIIASWIDTYDRNNNSFYQYARLIINVDIDASLQKDLYANLYYKKAEESEYTLYHEIPDFSIDGQKNSDTISCIVGSKFQELASGEYDFRIELFEKGSYILVAYADEAVTELNNVKFESKEDDEYFYWISNLWWTDQVDNDGDGYTSLRKLNFDIDVDKNEQRSLYALIFHKFRNDSSYVRYDSTANFNITGISAGDPFSVTIGQIPLDSAKYDFLISIYEARLDTVRIIAVSASSASDTLFYQQKFEPALKD